MCNHHEALRQAGSLIPYTEALEHCREWITNKGATTDSAHALQQVLLSLAGQAEVKLNTVRVLDQIRLSWFTTIITNVRHISKRELMYAAGQENES